MAHEGDDLCRKMLGNTLWAGSEPKYVIVRDGETAEITRGLQLSEDSVDHQQCYCG